MLGISTIKAGDTIIADDGFDCIDAGAVRVEADEKGKLYVPCRGALDENGDPEEPGQHRHYLDGQCDDGEHMIGFSAP